MHPASLQLPLLAPAPDPAFQNAVQRPAAVPPSPNFLVRMARSSNAQLLGTHTVKYFSGVMIGIGLMLTPAGGLGLGLIIAGSALWALSTALSTAALHDKTGNAIYRHIGASLMSGGFGLSLGMAAVPLAALSAATQPGAGILAATLVIVLSVALPAGMDSSHNRNEDRYALEIATIRSRITLKNNMIDTLAELFESRETVTVRQRHHSDNMATIEFHMEDRQDKLSCNSIDDSDREWIAVERAPHCYDLFERSSFYNEAGQPRYTHHPYTRRPMRNVDMIGGQRLLDLLRQAQNPKVDAMVESC